MLPRCQGRVFRKSPTTLDIRLAVHLGSWVWTPQAQSPMLISFFVWSKVCSSIPLSPSGAARPICIAARETSVKTTSLATQWVLLSSHPHHCRTNRPNPQPFASLSVHSQRAQAVPENEQGVKSPNAAQVVGPVVLTLDSVEIFCITSMCPAYSGHPPKAAPERSLPDIFLYG